MHTFSILLPLTTLTVTEAVDRARWPAHITLVGNFRAPAAESAERVLRRFATEMSPIGFTVEDEAWFGPDGSVLVDLVEVPRLLELHSCLLDRLETAVGGLEMIDPQHTREGYRPHRTVTTGPRPSPGDLLEASDIALVELDPPGRTGVAVVLGVWPLQGAVRRRGRGAGAPAAAPASRAPSTPSRP